MYVSWNPLSVMQVHALLARWIRTLALEKAQYSPSDDSRAMSVLHICMQHAASVSVDTSIGSLFAGRRQC